MNQKRLLSVLPPTTPSQLAVLSLEALCTVQHHSHILGVSWKNTSELPEAKEAYFEWNYRREGTFL